MSVGIKEEFLKISSYEEYDRKRNEFKNLKLDEEVLEHLKNLCPKVDNSDYEKGIITEVYKKPRHRKIDFKTVGENA